MKACWETCSRLNGNESDLLPRALIIQKGKTSNVLFPETFSSVINPIHDRTVGRPKKSVSNRWRVQAPLRRWPKRAEAFSWRTSSY